MLYQTYNPHGGDVYSDKIILDFSANTNPYGTPEGVLAAIQTAAPLLRQYPDPCCRELVQAISVSENIPGEYILCGNGAAELIYSFCEAADAKFAVEFAPTFSEYSSAFQRTGGRMERFFLRQDCGFTPERSFLPFLEARNPEAIFLCNPNNPTGRLIPPQLLKEILDYSRERAIRLFLDECFLDLSDGAESMKKYLADNPRLLILKAFTKNYGMAGIRLGYCMSSDAGLLRKMSETVQPWNVSLLAQAAGTAALQEQDFLRKARKTIFQEKQYLTEGLENMGLDVCPSDANYLLFHGPAALHTKLREQGIAIRNCDNYHGLDSGWYRIAVRLHTENERLLQEMRQALGKA